MIGDSTGYCNLLTQIVKGNILIDHEEIWPKDQQKSRGVVVYEVGKGKIVKVLFPR